MYDANSLRMASERFFGLWRESMLAQGIAAPDGLTWDRELIDIWRDPGLLVAQTCGYPFVKGICGKVLLVATPCYDFFGCRGPYYRSVLVAHYSRVGQDLTAFAGQCAAVNSLDSYSGFHAFRAHLVRAHGTSSFFSSTRLTGSHTASAAAIADGLADLAAIDCVTWGHLKILEPSLAAQLCEIGVTEEAPGLPLITSASRSLAELSALRSTLAATLADPRSHEARKVLGLIGMQVLTPADYEHIERQSQLGAQMNWPAL